MTQLFTRKDEDVIFSITKVTENKYQINNSQVFYTHAAINYLVATGKWIQYP